jgi:hypothetical protein
MRNFSLNKSAQFIKVERGFSKTSVFGEGSILSQRSVLAAFFCVALVLMEIKG